MTTDAAGTDFPFGPFHRLESPTQTAEVAVLQESTGEIWGRSPKASEWPQVQAYRGPLPGQARGVEFFARVAPDRNDHPREARWSGGGKRSDVRTDGEFAKIDCVVTKNTQVER